MALLIFLVSVIFSHTSEVLATDPVDADCKTLLPDGTYVWSERATQCENIYRDKECERQYGDGSIVFPGGSSSRPRNCWMLEGTDGLYQPGSGAWTPNDIVKRGSVDVCPKLCGYCCKATEYICEWTIPAGYTPEIEKICKEVTWDKCQSSIAYRPIYAKYCPNFCGFCRINGCIDAIPSCSLDPSVCTSSPAFASQYCKATCGYCEQCKDNRTDCAALVAGQNFCNTAAISTVRMYCGQTCGIC
ncbi:hypothetical protein L5515_004193 [Caenorhabditis briggsae]|uniref:ShKT domain-containing protein n=1 Tax=Caenorhabditis briggsae TaxID=6238 RepID=A0AAE9JD35_CAEBR|nr:hypothetical protein L5515_004193 [Caenorhabditis briggsae]